MLTALLLTHAIVTAPPIEEQDRYAAFKEKMVPVGKKVPNFIVDTASGEKFDLYKSLKGSKGTIVNFWFAH